MSTFAPTEDLQEFADHNPSSHKLMINSTTINDFEALEVNNAASNDFVRKAFFENPYLDEIEITGIDGKSGSYGKNVLVRAMDILFKNWHIGKLSVENHHISTQNLNIIPLLIYGVRKDSSAKWVSLGHISSLRIVNSIFYTNIIDFTRNLSFPRNSTLRHLDLSSNFALVKSDFFNTLVKNLVMYRFFSNLRTLRLSRNFAFDNNHLDILVKSLSTASISRLKELDISECGLTPGCGTNIKTLILFNKLKRIRLGGNDLSIDDYNQIVDAFDLINGDSKLVSLSLPTDAFVVYPALASIILRILKTGSGKHIISFSPLNWDINDVLLSHLYPTLSIPSLLPNPAASSISSPVHFIKCANCRYPISFNNVPDEYDGPETSDLVCSERCASALTK